MAGLSEGLRAHIEGGFTTLCRCWAIIRADGAKYGFTDHDLTLEFDGIEFRADSGLSAAALQQGTGLAVDNSEAMGALSDASVRADEIEAGRFDGAEVRAWLVNWAEPGQRWLQFRGSIGEIRRAGGAFHAELRGLTEALNRPLGRVYQKPCPAVLGDVSCGVDPGQPGLFGAWEVAEVEDGRVFRWDDLPGFEAGWFARGRLEAETGPASGLWGMVKRDRIVDGAREIELWQPLPGGIRAGDRVRLVAGCDKRLETCRSKFGNLVNFQGFPDIPGDDWMMAVPKSTGANTGGSRR
jgi:uncharacterized phage protein (TIGR02218 family)